MDLALHLAGGCRRAIEWVARIMATIAGWAYVGTAVFVTLDALSRTFLGVSSGATTEISGYLLAFGISWSLAHGLAERAHIRVDLLVGKMPLWLRVWAHLAALLLLLGLVAILCWSATKVLGETMLFNARDLSALRIPLIWPQSLWAFGVFVLALFTAALTLEVVLLLAARRPDEIETLMHAQSHQEEADEARRALDEGKEKPREEDQP
ncbi:TRAP transporter small permease [Acidimangrovimonas sediminis]|uniref:TRAP transporter small permease n=1 Tax=Acidimangrovimonas sediminis TaxID=2056283 RepID=UPI000C800D07|nr:TRAP transporter small permease [Acidimangrovimonas sediminis]